MEAIRCGVRSVCAVLTLSAAATTSGAAEPLPGPYSAVVERVVDGDTLGVRVAIWLQLDLNILVRIRGIDAPELKGRCESERAKALDATAALERLVSGGQVQLRRIEGDKFFGRVVADVATLSGGDVAATLVAEGFVRTYDGGRRLSWCEVGMENAPTAGGLASIAAPD